jgi:hypothetical protein
LVAGGSFGPFHWFQSLHFAGVEDDQSHVVRVVLVRQTDAVGPGSGAKRERRKRRRRKVDSHRQSSLQMNPQNSVCRT